jgi:hypothetical protein
VGSQRGSGQPLHLDEYDRVVGSAVLHKMLGARRARVALPGYELSDGPQAFGGRDVHDVGDEWTTT